MLAATLLALVQASTVVQGVQSVDTTTWQATTVEVIGVDEGLSSASVTSLLQDRRGFLWVGTQDGLNRFDGHGFRSYQAALGDSSSLPEDYVRSLWEDSSGALWVGLEMGGLARLRDDGESFERFPLSELGPWQRPRAGDPFAMTGRTVWDIVEFREGTLVLATDVGPVEFTVEGGRATLVEQASAGASALTSSNGVVWVGGADGGVVRYEAPEGGRLRRTAYVDLGAEIAEIVLREGRLWVAANEAGVHALDPLTLDAAPSPLVEPASQEAVRALAFDEGPGVWLGTPRGLALLEPNEAPTWLTADASDPRTIPEAGIRALLVDRGGNVWIGTWGGLARLSRHHRAIARIPTRVGRREGLATGVVSIAEDASGDLWVGTLGQGLDHLTLASTAIRHYGSSETDARRPSGGAVFDLATDGDELWLALVGAGINRRAAGSSRFERLALTAIRTPPEPLEAHSVFRDGSGRVYAGTRFSGLQQWDSAAGRFRPVPGPDGGLDLGSDYVWPMVETGDGALWVGALGGGLNRLGPDRTSHRRWSTADGLSPERILTLFADAAGRLWIGTEGGGLNRFDPATEEFTVYTSADGLPHDNVTGILEDDFGYLWVSTNSGIARFDPDTEEFWTFREPSGLAGDGHYANSAYKDPRGRLFFGGPEGLTMIDPSGIALNRAPPPVALTGLRIHDDEVPVSRALGRRGLELEYEDRFFTFRFAALDYSDPAQNRYEYRLDPLETEWRPSGNDPEAPYTTVPPDRYRFLVRARNSEGVWNEAGLDIPVWVRAPWWQTWRFRSAVMATIALAISALYRYRLNQIRSREALRLKIAGQLHDDIGANLSAMALKAEVARSSSARGKPNEKQLGDIARLARETAHQVRETVWVVNTSYDTVAGVVSKMQDTLDVMLDGRMSPRFSAPDNLPTTPVGMELRQDVYLLYKELLQNVVKHSKADSVAVEIRYEAPMLTLTVRDDGRGFDPADPKQGNGLDLMRRRAEKHSGTLTFESRPGEGTTARLVVRMR